MAIFTLRSDFLGEFQRHQGLLGLAREHLSVGPMAADQLPKIIEGPAKICSIELEDGLKEAMVSDSEGQDSLPLLAFTLRELYERCYENKQCVEDKHFEVNVYRKKLGGLSGAVARAADAAYTAVQLSTDQEQDLRRALVSLVRINEEGQFTRQPALWSDLPASVHGVLEQFVKARLLRSLGEGKEKLLEVSHEALFQSWRRLKVWLGEDREFLLWRKRFQEALQEWLRTGRNPGALLAGPALN
ncbi:MAG: hypothetical protein KJP23_08710, partial [Deltaproteobacteria bacterium]|nr:hypothetical protein [Deltaproteobacteria bacterium]